LDGFAVSELTTQQTSGNAHVAEERNQLVEDWTKDEEEK
jgi:hypothetical protein